MSNEISQTVMCKKLNQELPALSRAPWPGDLGKRILAEISAQAWGEWRDHAKMLLNEYRLNMGTPEAQAFMSEQMQAFLFSEGTGAKVEGYVPPSE